MILEINGGSGFHKLNMHGEMNFPNLRNMAGSRKMNGEDQPRIWIYDEGSFHTVNKHEKVDFLDLGNPVDHGRMNDEFLSRKIYGQD